MAGGCFQRGHPCSVRGVGANEFIFDVVRFDERGLVPVIAQDVRAGRVLMLAYANREALEKTLETGDAHYFSRSRGALWRKGETSGHTQRVSGVLVDCDGDAILYRVEQTGPACHTGAPACFYREAGSALGGLHEIAPHRLAAAHLTDALHAVVLERIRAGGERSYTRKLAAGGAAAIGEKIREEAAEAARALVAEDDKAVVHEVADLWFHASVGLAMRGLSPAHVWEELARRFGVSGLDEKAAREHASSGAKGNKDEKRP